MRFSERMNFLRLVKTELSLVLFVAATSQRFVRPVLIPATVNNLTVFRQVFDRFLEPYPKPVGLITPADSFSTGGRQKSCRCVCDGAAGRSICRRPLATDFESDTVKISRYRRPVSTV